MRSYALTWLFPMAFLASTSAASAPRTPPAVEGQQYLRMLAAEIRQSDRIFITEHAFTYDAFDGAKMKTRLPLPLIYATRELTGAQRDAFARTVGGLSPRPGKWLAMCLPEPHHTVTFYRNGIESSKMDICFGCGLTRWSATELTPPPALEAALGTMVTSVGLHPTLDWKALARAYLDSTTAQP